MAGWRHGQTKESRLAFVGHFTRRQENRYSKTVKLRKLATGRTVLSVTVES